MSKIYSLSLEKGMVRILADFFKQRFNKITIKIWSMGEMHYMIVLNGQFNWFIWMLTFIGILLISEKLLGLTS